ncbi:multi-sensor signal transduction histidine kinase [Leptolyngbya sp. NIES-3755]|nr:multi-sensor signal transduction histidine kinase [Leptolyngbya sp. NIES-3755]
MRSQNNTQNESLIENETYFKAIANLVPDMLWQNSPEGKALWYNQRWLDYTGQTLEEAQGDGWLETIHPDDRAASYDNFHAAVRECRPLRHEHRIRDKDGNYRWFLVRAEPMIDPNGTVIWFGAATDVHPQRIALEQARSSEALAKAMIQNLPGGAGFVIDRDFRYLLAEGEALAIAGFKPEDFLGRTLFEMIPPELLPTYEALYRQALSGEPFEHEHHSHDRWYVSRGTPLRTDTGEVYAVLAVSYDITDRMSAEDDRKQTEKQLRRAAELDAFRVKLSDALRSLSNPVEIQQAAMRVVGEHLKADRVLYAEISDDGETISVADNYVRGDFLNIVGQFLVSDFGTAGELLSTGQNFITTDAERDERFSAVELEAMLALGNVSVLAVPCVKNNRWVSNFAAYHREPHEWTADEIRLVEEAAERTWAAVERARAERALQESEIQRIQEQAAREEERQRAESLAELDRAKTAFFSNISHEFRTPLTLLINPLEEALNDRSISPKLRDSLELAHRNSLRLLKLVNTLLDFSRIEAGRIEAVYEPTDLSQFTAELASVFRSTIEQAGLRFTVDCLPLPEAAYVDRELWEKIVFNLLSNAFKFTLEGEITVRLHPVDHHLILEIEDTGVGIAPEELPHLFERFYQVKGTQARSHEGSGIGLALVHELVQLQGGTINVTSTVGVGTCFTIALPLGSDHLPHDRIKAPRALDSTAMGAAPYLQEAELWKERDRTLPSDARILLVDDNADMREYLTRILSEQVAVEAVTDGAAALLAVQRQLPDLILSDVMMPGVDGFQLLQTLRDDPQTREIPIILLSARAGEEAIVEGLQAGADDYLIKPFSAQELISRIQTHLQRGKALYKAREMNQRKDELLSTVSHELNTPLVSILGWTRLLRSSPPNSATLSKALNTIERNATLQAKLVQDLLDFSRMNAGKLHLQPQPTELTTVIETAIATVDQTATTKGIDLLWQAPTQDLIANVDRDRLQQVLCNLLNNAIKFTPAGGSITIELSAVTNSQAEIRVIDTGIGISADFLPRVFDRFQQERESTKGIGLGLAIARHLVELHGGTIHAESDGEGQGATFRVCLPLLDSSEI